MPQFRTLKLRVRDKHAKRLRHLARGVNYVWNYVNEVSFRSITQRGKFLTAFDLHHFTRGAHKELGLHSHTLNEIAKEFVTRRKQARKAKLAWRKSEGSRRSLGWIPISSGSATWKNGQVYHYGCYYRVWDSFDLGNYKFKSASFNEDARGRWYFNVVVEVSQSKASGSDSVGVVCTEARDLVGSDGKCLSLSKELSQLNNQLRTAERRNQRRSVAKLSAKLRNKKKDLLHKFSSKLVTECSEIYLGRSKGQVLSKKQFRHSGVDPTWSTLKTMLEYKCDSAGIVFKVVDTAYTADTCSNCGAKRNLALKGTSGIGIRVWDCDACGVTHDSYLDESHNILALGHGRPIEEMVGFNPT